MKKFWVCSVLLLTAGTAHAIPFTWNGGSLNATGALALASYSPSSGSVDLADNETASNLLFGSVSLLGVGSGTLEVGVNFTSPSVTASTSGPYQVFSAFIFSGGNWTGGSTTFAYGTGLARLTLDAISIPLQLGPTFNFLGSITNLGSADPTSVPEPGTLALLGMGLIGIGLSKRRKKV